MQTLCHDNGEGLIKFRFWPTRKEGLMDVKKWAKKAGRAAATGGASAVKELAHDLVDKQEDVTRADFDALVERIDRLEVMIRSNQRQLMEEFRVILMKVKAIQEGKGEEWTTTKAQAKEFVQYDTIRHPTDGSV